jgi:acyl carrier protein
MIITLEPNQEIEVRFAHSRDEHGEPRTSDGSITVKYDDISKKLVVLASEPDSSGRNGVVYEENFEFHQMEMEIEAAPDSTSSATKPHLLTDEQLLDDIRRIVSEHLDTDPETIKSSSSIMDDLGADSLDLIELVMAVEWEYGIEIPDEDADGIETVGDFLTYLRKKFKKSS